MTDTNKKVWAIFVTQDNAYVNGARVLVYSLKRVKTRYSVIIVHTNNLRPQTYDEFVRLGCKMRAVERISPPPAHQLLWPYYTELWTKLRVWELEEFERVVLLDADMLVLRNMDELMELRLDPSWVAASHACTCNPMGIAKYPKEWTPDTCAFNDARAPESTLRGPDKSRRGYFNSGLLVLTPSNKLFAECEVALTKADASKLLFGDQDLVNIVFKDRWHVLPYVYNALKTLRHCHAPMWTDDNVKNIHYILKKPWDFVEGSELSMKDPSYELVKLWHQAEREYLAQKSDRNINDIVKLHERHAMHAQNAAIQQLPNN